MWEKIVKAFEKIGQARATAELKRMGYTPEYLETLVNDNLKGWV